MMSQLVRPPADLFDTTIGYEDETGVRVAKNLSPEDRERAATLYKLFNGLWGLCIVVGDPGTGKDLFGNYLALQVKRLFPWKRILRDEKPRELFGDYAGLFNDKVLAEELSRMRLVASGHKRSETNIGDVLDSAADQWVTEKGEVLLKNSLLYLTELWRYCYNREPHNPMNKTMGAIHKLKRHLDCLIIGTVQLPTELDKKTCLPWVDWKVTCTRSATNPTGFCYYVNKVAYDRRMDVLTNIGQPFSISFDAGLPRSYLGDGKLVLRQNGYRPENEEERVVLTVLRAGVDTYEKLVEVLEAEGDMTEDEILVTVKELKFNRRKRVLDYPCFFGVYNSKSVPQVQTSLRVED
ncbi:hypothetical protein LCGC14_1560240 [marine sediment metagenome]|uniref:Uncharacterized protein n=1 Tax=marine sediment metagenome TaxID=412755 RepID=A0A0F9LNF4_9ZZZZ